VLSAFKLGIYSEKNKNYDDMINYLSIVISSLNFKYTEQIKISCYKLGKYYKSIGDYANMIKYFTISIDENCDQSMCELANYYKYIEQDYEQMKIYYHRSISINNDNLESIYELGLYYKNFSQNSSEAIKYLSIVAEKNYLNSNFELAEHYEKEENYKQMEKHYRIAILNGCVNSMFKLGLYHKNITKKFKLMKKYFEMSIECNYTISLGEYGDYYFEQNDFSNAVELYEKSFMFEDTKSFCNLVISYLNLQKYEEVYRTVLNFDKTYIKSKQAKINESNEFNISNEIDINKNILYETIFKITNYYISKKDTLNANKYYLMGINLGSENAYTKLESECGNKLILYNLITSIQDPNEFVKIKIKELLKDNDVKFYENKITLFTKLNNIKECIVCYNTKIHVNLNCGHEICLDCYCHMNICQFRCSTNIKRRINDRVSIA
jgi:tetratricopeptide (TPR) repeat protein